MLYASEIAFCSLHSDTNNGCICVEMEAYRYVLLYLSINSAPNDRDYTFETIMLDNKRAHIADAAASEDI